MSVEHTGGGISQPPPNKLATAWWFARRPHTYRHLVEMLRRLASPKGRRMEATGSAARAWGEERAVGWREALAAVLGPGEWPSLESLHPRALSEAKEIAARAPVTMGGAAALDLLYHLVVGTGARRAVETGVAYGWSSLAILLGQRELGGGRLVSTDMPYPRADNEVWVGCVVPDELRSGWTILRRPDRPGLGRALAAIGEVDLAHYDSDKTYAGRAWAYPRIWRGLRPGGVLISDDVQDNLAFRDFSERVGTEPAVVSGEGKLIGVLVKPEGA